MPGRLWMKSPIGRGLLLGSQILAPITSTQVAVIHLRQNHRSACEPITWDSATFRRAPQCPYEIKDWMLKCDERKPVCGQCQKARRECVASPGIVFRHQQNASLNAQASDTLGRFYGYKKSFAKDSVWVKVPPDLTFVHIDDPFSEEQAGDGIDASTLSPANQDPQTPSSAGISAHASAHSVVHRGSDTTHSLTTPHGHPLPPPDHGHTAFPRPGQGSVQLSYGSAQDINFILNRDSPNTTGAATGSYLDFASPASFASRPTTRADRIRPRRRWGEILYKDEDDISFLLRHFSHGPGHWMDLFDLGRFFEMDVPVKATRSPLLLYSAVALAAKSLGRLSPLTSHLRNTRLSSNEWLHRGRTYYDRAIHYLRQALEAETSSLDPTRTGYERSWDVSNGDLDLPSWMLPRTNSDELVGTTAILCVYEFLDGSGAEWSQHLDGAKSLFDIAKDSVLAMPSGSSDAGSGPTLRPWVNNRIAIFWNIARQDMLEGFINKTASRLDTEHISMWRSVGLHITDAGFILPSNDPERYEPMQDDMICNALVWLVMKLVNQVAARDRHTVSQRELPDAHAWTHLSGQFDVWFDGLPDSFRPVSSSWTDTPGLSSSNPRLPLPRKWYARPMCASTMQWYHFARIQMLHHRLEGLASTVMDGNITSPHESYRPTNPSQELLAQVQEEGRAHAEEIISIGLAQTDEGVLVHSVQPLFAAGQALFGVEMDPRLEDVRRCLIDHLGWIERETGWATEYRAKQLLDAWVSGR